MTATNLITVELYKPRSVDGVVNPDLKIVTCKSLDFLGRDISSSFYESRRIMEEQAESAANAMLLTLPGGVLDRIAFKMAARCLASDRWTLTEDDEAGH